MIDIQANRGARKYSRKEQALRVAWSVGQWLFRLSPRPLFAFRRQLLRLFGAKIGRHVHIYPTATIMFPWMLEMGDWSCIGDWALIYDLGRVRIGERATISHRAHLCAGTHDYADPALPLQRVPIEIGAQSWICAEAFVGPGVEVGEGAIVGARAVAIKNVPPWAIVGGNPARQLGLRTLRIPQGESED